VEDLRAAFGRRIRELREGKRLSQETLAERAGLHWTYVSGIERGRRAPGLDVIGRIAAGLRVSPSELFAPLIGKYRTRTRKRTVRRS
jgi:transcriptional regulator with XRE-family HTH domain